MPKILILSFLVFCQLFTSHLTKCEEYRVAIEAALQIYQDKNPKDDIGVRIVDYKLVCSIIQQESSFRPKARSFVNAVGLMQVRYIALLELSRLNQPFGINMENPSSNIFAGLNYLFILYKYTPEHCRSNAVENLHFVLSAYNKGVGRMIKNGTCKTNYSNQVLHRMYMNFN